MYSKCRDREIIMEILRCEGEQTPGSCKRAEASLFELLEGVSDAARQRASLIEKGALHWATE
jgi:hypothetical protein